MAEYIEKQAVMNKFAEVVAPSNNSDFQKPPTWNDSVEIVENFPPADVRPVVRGRWEVTPIYIKCSECGESFMLIPQNFCPHCGSYNGGDAECQE